MVRKGVFIVRLNDKLARDKACEMSGILFEKNYFIIKPWKVKMSLEKEDLSSIPIWIHLPALVNVGVKDASERLLGFWNKDILMYARALVEMDIRKGLPDEVFFTNEYDELVKQAIQYDWKPNWCHQCQQLGHQSGACQP